MTRPREFAGAGEEFAEGASRVVEDMTVFQKGNGGNKRSARGGERRSGTAPRALLAVFGGARFAREQPFYA
ncbi:hypothetical protein GCM10009851_30450 [Herbiconiux moechotypicola]|uniref:Uncharacterized protein n=1 Tax=Herbiconiux moechotypicola TaxID=637393 RepID=A0ABP5QRU1_9MICO